MPIVDEAKELANRLRSTLQLEEPIKAAAMPTGLPPIALPVKMPQVKYPRCTYKILEVEKQFDGAHGYYELSEHIGKTKEERRKAGECQECYFTYLELRADGHFLGEHVLDFEKDRKKLKVDLDPEWNADMSEEVKREINDLRQKATEASRTCGFPLVNLNIFLTRMTNLASVRAWEKLEVERTGLNEALEKDIQSVVPDFKITPISKEKKIFKELPPDKYKEQPILSPEAAERLRIADVLKRQAKVFASAAYKCNLCSEKFTSIGSKAEHERLEHMCPVCGEISFKSMKDIKKHLGEKHAVRV